MVERVETGGLMRFDYSSSEQPKLGEERKREIEEAYERYYARRRREMRRKFFIILLIVVVIIGGILAFVFS